MTDLGSTSVEAISIVLGFASTEKPRYDKKWLRLLLKRSIDLHDVNLLSVIRFY